MKGNKFFYRSILFFLLSVSALSFAILGFENGFPYAVSFDNFKRSISTPPEITYAQDLSASYNERGYYKSNSAFGDGSEIINDFNGNLMYEIPIAKAKCDGDLYYDFNLNYNGNVNYNVITNDAAELSYVFTLLNIYNITAPGWIFSINGFAVQMLNFESKFTTKPPFGTTAYGNNVRLLASGYHITHMFPSGDAENDRITIMLGDGSTEVIENLENQTDVGIYKSKAKGSYLKARVISGNQTEYYRTMYLMKGDGLTYIFKEYKNSYTDVYSQTQMPEWYKPKSFYLTEIADRFGNTISLDYIGVTGKNIGRKWLNSINGSDITVSYASVYDQYTGMKITTIDGNFRFSTSTFGVGATDDHRPRLLSILNPTGETTSFGYASYVREATDLAYTSESQMKISMGGNGSPGLNRLSRIDGFDGSVRLYDYVPTSESSISFQQEGPEKPHSSHSYYKGYGRDLFFTNMIANAVINNGSNDIRRIDYLYDYVYNREDVFINPIDTTDNCITTKTVTSLDTTYDYDTPQTNKTKKYYKIYNTNPQFSGEYLEYNGTIRLIRDYYYTDNEENPFKLVYNDYYMGYNNVYFEGSFLDKSITETITSVSRTAQFGYDINSTTGLIETKHETDPFGRVTSTDYVSFYLEDYEVFKEGKFIVAGSANEYSDIYFYLIHQPSEINVLKDNTLLKKTGFDYFNPSSVINPQSIVQGYPGQLKEQKEYDPSANTVLRSVNYVYYNQDTTGKHMKPSSFSCTNEGNLKEITDANGNKTKYYYHVISRTEEEGYNSNCNNTDEENCPYRVSYHVFNDDGTVDIGKSSWQDSRLPTRTDGYYAQDNFITNYNLYNKIGNPLKIVSPNRCLSDVTYQNYYRLGVITMPYDFSDTPPDIIKTPVQTSSSILVTSGLVKWGGRNELDVQSSFLSDNSGTLPGARIEHHYSIEDPDNPSDTKYNMLLKFDDSEFNTISVIDSAFLEFSPYYLLANLNNESTGDYSFYIKPLTQLDGSQQNMTYTEGSGLLNLGNLPASADASCTKTLDAILEQYTGNFKKIDITQLLNSNVAGNALNLQGLKLSMSYTGEYTSGIVDLKMYIYTCSNVSSLYNYWVNNFAPVLKIYARHIDTDTIVKINYNSGTVINTYDDINNKVKTQSKIDKTGSSNRWKTVENYFDKFGKQKSARLYVDETNYNQSELDYNYLDLKARLSDPLNNRTKISYSKYFNPSKTENPDASYTLVSETYLNGYSYSFGTITGMVIKKVLTDETGKNFEKYYDAVGNLRREIKYVEGIPDDDPEEDEDIPLITDYKYDDLYRVTEVKTPDDKHIYYSYDGLGRQSARTTPDAGTVKYKYDKNDNLRFSQDNNQANKPTETPPSKHITFRGYDGINRLLYIGDTYNENYLVSWDNLNPDNSYNFENYGYTPENFLVINVYDTLTNYPAGANIFTAQLPSDYYYSAPNGANNTKGSLCATAYRTMGTDSWSYKYYRYDARGRVIKMWNYIAGLGEKTTIYEYNSQNQVTDIKYQSGYTDGRKYKYDYDYAGRLLNTSINYIPQDAPEDYLVFNSYTYNQNSQINTFKFDPIYLTHTYSYDTRSRITNNACSKPDLFSYSLTYYSNSNINTQTFTGQYKNSFSNQDNLSTEYTYDKSNRLTNTNFTHTQDNTFDLANTYDYDGNILTLQRYGSSNNLVDNFSYQYYTGTNKLKKVSGSTDQYTYDYNGNQANDYLNNNTSIKYDHRNLITEFTRQDLTQEPPITDVTRYKYDEAGNRIRKTIYRSNDSNPTPLPEEEEDLPQGWSIIKDEYYSRDATGKEIAIYSSYTLQYWNVWSGNEITGRINFTENEARFYYLKDHLGSIRVVLDNSKNIVSANDFDMWGYYLENRTYSTTNTKNKFTGKERDTESNWDYFGARYYDARVGRWLSTDPLINKYPGFSTYCYTLNNTQTFTDPTGLWIPEYDSETNTIRVVAEKDDNLADLYNQLGISADEFAKTFDINNINDFQVEEGKTSFDITNFVTPNSDYISGEVNSNCFGFCVNSHSQNSTEIQADENELFSILKLSENASSPKSGNISVFKMSDNVISSDGAIIYKKGTPGHAAIFIIKDKSGQPYYLHRMTLGERVTLNTKKQINEYFEDYVSRNKKMFKQLPGLESNPVYYNNSNR